MAHLYTLRKSTVIFIIVLLCHLSFGKKNVPEDESKQDDISNEDTIPADTGDISSEVESAELTLPPELKALSLLAEPFNNNQLSGSENALRSRSTILRANWPRQESKSVSFSHHDCSVCSKEQNACQVIAGIFSRSPLSYGYNLVTSFPSGVCDISIAELQPSKNYLALKRKDGQYVLNGDWSLEAAGSYPIAGTIFSYGPGDETKGERLNALGLLTEPLELMIIYQSPNPGIKYEYKIPPSSSVSPQFGGYPQVKSQDPLIPGAVKPVKLPILPSDGSTKQQILSNSGRQVSATSPVQLPYPSLTYQAQQQRRTRLYQRPLVPDQQEIIYNKDTGSSEVFVNPIPIYNNSSGILGNNFRSPVVGGVWRNTVDKSIHASVSARRNNTIPLVPSSAVDKVRRRKFHHNPRSHSFVRRKSPRHQWVSKGYSECSRSCGGGTKTLRLVCERRRRRAKVVSDRFCQSLPPPRIPQSINCNLSPCPARWVGGIWGPCSTTCGIGIQQRELSCQQEISSSLTMAVHEGACLDPPTAPTSQSCEVRPCPGTRMASNLPSSNWTLPKSSPAWQLGEWGPCSTDCGVGTRKRSLSCLNSTGVTVSSESCYAATGVTPISEQLCDMGSCSSSSWLTSDWSKVCSSECGKGVVSRRVHCDVPSMFSKELCRSETKPNTTKSCEEISNCQPHWFRGQWSSCRGDCEVGLKTRPVTCVIKVDSDLQWQVVPESRCDRNRKPTSKRECRLSDCKPSWFVSPWSECSASCGGGVMRRKTKCVIGSEKTSTDCPEIARPSVRKPCNLHKCGVDPSVIANVRLPDGSPLLSDKEKGAQSSRVPNEDGHRNSERAEGAIDSKGAQNNNGDAVVAQKDQYISSGEENNEIFDEKPSGEEISSSRESSKEKKRQRHGGSCGDRMKNCHLVFRARLCRLKYYNKLCCKTCRDGPAEL